MLLRGIASTALVACLALVPASARAIGNLPPSVSSVSFSRSPVPAASPVRILCNASDADGSVVSLRFAVSGGSLGAGGGSQDVPVGGSTVSGSAVWNTPAAGTYTVTCTAKDNGDPFPGSGSKSVSVVVADGAQGPVIDSLAADLVEIFPSGHVHLNVVAHHTASAAMTFAWSAAVGTFGAPTSDSTDWTAPTSTGDYLITVVASDGAGGSATATIVVRVRLATASTPWTLPSGSFYPRRIAVDAVGKVYVTDSRAGRIVVFSPLGAFVQSIAVGGQPAGLAVLPNGHLLVGDEIGLRVYRLDGARQVVGMLGSGYGEFEQPGAITVDSTGTAYVADGKAGVVKVFDPGGPLLQTLAVGGFPAGVAFDAGKLYVADLAAGKIKVYGSTWQLERTIGSYGVAAGQLTRVSGIALSSNDQIFASDSYQGAVLVFASTGAYAGSIGQYGRAPGQLSIPLDVALDAAGRVLVANSDVGRIEIFVPPSYTPPTCAADADCDGLPDAWETANGLNPNDPSDALVDSDGDGLRNDREFALGTDPRKADTDGDGVADGTELSAGDNPRDPSDNRPVALAIGPSLTDPTRISLDGLSSSDPKGLPLSFSWRSISGPATVALEGATTALPSFIGRKAGAYVFGLTVNNGRVSSPEAQVTVSVANLPPTSFAGPDLSGSVGTAVTLEGRFSVDANGDAITLAWTQRSGPQVALQTDPSGRAQFVPAETGVYAFELVASDAVAAGKAAVVHVLVGAPDDRIPTASLQEPSEARVGETVTLSGEGSVDADGDALTFSWVQSGGPEATLADADQPKATFAPAFPGVYRFELTVADAKHTSLPARVTVVVSSDTVQTPIAEAGFDQHANVLETVSLDGAGSRSDATTQFGWTQIEGPPVPLAAEGSKATFLPLDPGTYVFELEAWTSGEGTRDRVTVVVDAADLKVPIAAADALATGDGKVRLVASAGAGEIGFVWTQVAGPQVLLSDPWTAEPTFAVPGSGSYVFEVRASAGSVLGPPARATWSAGAPIAVAGDDLLAKADEGATLDGSASSSPNAGDLSFKWKQTGGPAAKSSVEDGAKLTVVPALSGYTLRFALTVTDSLALSASDEVDVSFVDVPLALQKVGTEGGTVSTDAGPRVAVPAGALPSPISVAIGWVTRSWWSQAGRAARGDALFVGPVGARFASALKVSVPLGDSAPSGLEASVFDHDADAWSPVAVEVDSDTRFARVELAKPGVIQLHVAAAKPHDPDPDPDPKTKDGCGCAATPGLPPLALLLLPLAGLAVRRRRPAGLVALAIACASSAAFAADPPHDSTKLVNACADCHIGHNAPGLGLTTVAGNSNLCASCHAARGAKSWPTDQQAIPGTSGTSHRWDAPVENSLYGASTPTNGVLANEIRFFGMVTCSVCHDQHSQGSTPFDPNAPATAGSAGRHFLRISNDKSQLCLGCHGSWMNASVRTATGGYMSHPVGVTIPGRATYASTPLDGDGRAQAPRLYGRATGGSTTTLVDSTRTFSNVADLKVRFVGGAVDGLVRAIESGASNTITFAAVPLPGVTAGVRYEIDADGNATNDLPLSSDGTVSCMTCHAVHDADSDSSTHDSQAGAGDGKLLRRTNDGQVCGACHKVASHNSAVVGTKYGTWGQSFDCRTCHQPHRTANAYLVKPAISTPTGSRPVVLNRKTGEKSMADGDTTLDGPCEVCHTLTNHFRRDGSAPDQVHAGDWIEGAGADCTTCHPHRLGFKPACSGCHMPTPATESSPGAAGAHAKHVQELGYGCKSCHDGAIHNQGDGTVSRANVQVAFRARNYNRGTTIGNGGTPSETLVAGTPTCQVGCHNPIPAEPVDDTADLANSVAWTAGTIACSACHERQLDLMNGQSIDGTTFQKAHPISSAGAAQQRADCQRCHDQTSHTNGRVWLNRWADRTPTRTEYLGTDAELDAICKGCHTSWGGSLDQRAPFNIAASYASPSGDFHGARSGTGWGGTIKAPYARGQAPIACAVCHGKHATQNAFGLRDVVNGNVIATPILRSGKNAEQLCRSCHDGVYHQGCANCHGGDPIPPPQACFYCHTHDGVSNFPSPDYDHGGGSGDCTHCHSGGWFPWGHQDDVTPPTLSGTPTVTTYGTTAIVSFNPGSTDWDIFNAYVEFSEGSECCNSSQGTAGYAYAPRSVQVTGLKTLTTYSYRVYSEDRAHNGVVSGVGQFTTKITDAPTTPVLVAEPDIGSTTDVAVTLDWNPSVDPNSDAIEYSFHLSTRSDFVDPFTCYDCCNWIEDEGDWYCDSYSCNPHPCPPSGDVEFKSGWISARTYTVTLPPGKDYYWRVQARDAVHPTFLSAWSATDVFGISWPPPVPVPVPVPDQKYKPISVSLALSWSQVTHPYGFAIDYGYEVAKSPDFAPGTIVRSTFWQQSTTSAPISFPSDYTYYWRVRTRDRAHPQIMSDWSAVDDFIVCTSDPPPAPALTPLPDITTPTSMVTFTWSAVTVPDGDAAQYLVQIADNANFTNPIPPSNTWINGTSITSAAASKPHYYWRVRARDGGTGHTNVNSPWSEVDDYLVYQPPSTPTLNAHGVVPSPVPIDVLLSWNPSTKADANPIEYQVQISTRSDFSDPTTCWDTCWNTCDDGDGPYACDPYSCNPHPCSPVTDWEQFSPWQAGTNWTINLSPTKQYYWRVVARDAIYPILISTWSATGNFWVRPAAPPPTPSPSWHAEVVAGVPTPVTVSWSASTAVNGFPVEYQAEIARSDTILPTDPGYQISSWGLTTSATFTLDPAPRYYWRVRARDSVLTDQVSDWCNRSNFAFRAPTTPTVVAQAPDPILTPAGSPNDPVPVTLRWNAATNANGNPVEYQLHVSVRPDFSDPTVCWGTCCCDEFDEEYSCQVACPQPLDPEWRSGWISQTQWPVTLPPGRTYYWHVQARDAVWTELVSSWSAADSFLVKAPTAPSAPANLLYQGDLTSGVPVNVTLKWYRVNPPNGYAIEYYLDVSTAADFSTSAANSGWFAPPSPTALQVEATVTLAPAPRYYWRVRARDSYFPALTSPWSYTLNFGFRAPPAPTVIDCANLLSQSPVAVALSWNPVADPDGNPVEYRVQISTRSDFSDPTVCTTYVYEECCDDWDCWECGYWVSNPCNPQTDFEWYTAWTSATSTTIDLSPGRSYYWRVYARDALWPTLVSPASGSDAFAIQLPTPPSPAPVPVHHAEVGATGPTDVTLQWNASSSTNGKTVEYLVEVSQAAGFSPLTGSSGWVATTQTTFTLAPGAYSWRVKARDAFYTNAETAWATDSFQFSAPPAPTLNPVSDLETEVPVPVTLLWSAAVNPYGSPLEHRAQVATTSDFSVLYWDTEWTSSTSTTPTLSPGNTYYWRVASRDSVFSTLVSTWTTGSFQVRLPTAPAPVPALTDQPALTSTVAVPVTLSWAGSTTTSAYTGHGVQYWAELSTASDFGAGYQNSGWIDATQFTFTVSPAARYYWRVKARDSVYLSAVGAWSETSTFDFSSLPRPTGLAANPYTAYGSSTASTTFNWTAVANPYGHPVEYQVVVSTSSSFTTTYADSGWIGSNNWPFTGAVASPSRRYYWRVTARDQTWTTLVSPVSSSASFYAYSYSNPYPPSLIDRTDIGGLPPVSVPLSWNPASPPNGNPVQYKVQVATNSTFTNVVSESDWISTTTYTASLSGYQTFYWRVMTRDSVLTTYVSSWSGYDSFNLTIPSPVPTVQGDAVFPCGTPSPSWSGTLSWSASANPNPETYRLQASRDGFATLLADLPWQSGQSYALSVTGYGPVYWRVAARDEVTLQVSAWPTQIFYVADDCSSSCPFVFSWNGTDFQYESDAAGSALEVPSQGPSAPSLFLPRYVSLQGLVPDGSGRLQVKVREPLAETSYIDRVRVLAIDHPVDAEIYNTTSDTVFWGYGTPYEVHGARGAVAPLAAFSTDDVDVTEAVASLDGTPAPLKRVADYGYIFDFGAIAHPENAKLLIDGWTLYGQRATGMASIQPKVQVRDPLGNWVTVATFGFPFGDRKGIAVPIPNAFLGADQRIRIVAGGGNSIAWLLDRIRLDDSDPVAIESRVLDAQAADLHYRGNLTYRGASYSGPFEAADDVIPDKAHFGAYGAFTRYGDVLPIVGADDDRYALMRHGDELSLAFQAPATPPAPGMVRSYVAEIDLYYKSIKKSRYVEPLPFKAMTAYPPPAGESYPTDPAHLDYVQNWNTRVVGP